MSTIQNLDSNQAFSNLESLDPQKTNTTDTVNPEYMNKITPTSAQNAGEILFVETAALTKSFYELSQNPELAENADFQRQVTTEIQAFEYTWNQVVENTYGGTMKQQMELELIFGSFAESLQFADDGQLVKDAQDGDSQAVGNDLNYMLNYDKPYYLQMEKSGELALEACLKIVQ